MTKSGDDGSGETLDDAERSAAAIKPVQFSSTMVSDGEAPPIDPDARELRIVDPKHYLIHGELARGGLGRIMRARDRNLDRPVAIKESLRVEGGATARFIREALVTARLQHPSIVPVYEAGRWPSGEPFYAMKLVSGRALSVVIAETRALEDRLALLPNVIAVADAIAYAHSERIIHRDLKPDNVLVGAFGETVVIDWGLAKDLSAGDSDDTDLLNSPYQVVSQGLTMAGAIMGTPEYMAPEQAQGKAVDERADVYAIGGILHHVLSGEPPFRGKTKEEILTQVMALAPAPIETGTEIPRDLVAIVRKAMARDPADRYPSAKQLADDLKRFQTGQLVSSRQYTLWQLAARWARRHRTSIVVAVAALILLVTTGIVAVRNVVHERATAQAAQATAEARTHELILVQARSALDRDPAAALAWLKMYPISAPNWRDGHEIAVEAQYFEAARHIMPHDNARSVRLSPDGRLVASSGRDKEIRLWDVASGKQVGEIATPVDVTVVEITPDAKQLAFAGINGTVFLAALPNGPAREILHHDGFVAAIAFSRDGAWLASAGLDGQVRMLERGTGVVKAVAGSQLAFTPDSKHLVTGGSDRAVRSFDLATGADHVIGLHDGPVTMVAVSPDGTQIASASEDKTVRVWNANGGEPMILRGHTSDHLERVDFSSDGQRIASQDDREVIVWQAATGAPLRHIHSRGPITEYRAAADLRTIVLASTDGSIDLVDVDTGERHALHGQRTLSSLDLSADGRHVAAFSDFAVRLWEVSPRGSRVLRGHELAVKGIAFSPDGATLVTASEDSTLRVWNVATGDSRVLRGHTGKVADLSFSSDGATVVSASEDRTVRIWTLATGDSKVLTGHLKTVWDPSFSRDGRNVFTASEDGTVRIWDVASGTSRVLTGHQGEVSTVDRSPDERTLVSVGDDGAIRVWDAKTGAARILGSHTGPVSEARFLPDGRHVVSRSGFAATSDRTIRLWDVDTGASRILLTAKEPLRSLAISPDGNSIAVGGQDGILRVITVAEGAIRELHGHTDVIKALRFSPDGTLIASASFDNTVRIWRVDTGASAIVHRHDGWAWNVTFSPDGRRLASTSRDGTAWVGDVDTAGCLPTEPALLMQRIQGLTSVVIDTDNRATTPK